MAPASLTAFRNGAKQMTRYILIDNNSGYIFGDSAEIGGNAVTGSPCEVAKALDESIGTSDYRNYEFVSGRSREDGSGYHVYTVEPAFPLVRDGTGRETIKAVESEGDYVGFVHIGSTGEENDF